MSYQHGAYGEIGNDKVKSAVQVDAVVAYIGTAPINLVLGYKEKGLINTPIKLENMPKTQATVGYSSNWNKFTLCDQYVRRTIRKYCSLASIDMHITPHMFRHTFATSLLEADVDIRYIQEMLGHSSIHITEIYTHVSTAKQRDILMNKHPRKNFRVG